MTADEAIANLMATLLPGGNGFPAARDSGMAALLAERLRAVNPGYPVQILAAVTRDKSPSSRDEWLEAAARLEAEGPKLFAEFRKYCYLTYYEQPDVIAAIRALGFRYNSSPLPEGYPDEPFDPARDGPHHARGRWLQTDEVTGVDVSALQLESLR